jgi:phasin
VPAIRQKLHLSSCSDFRDQLSARAKDTYVKAQAAAEETSKVMERTYLTASKGAADFNLHLLEMAQVNMNAAFDFARQLTRVKSPTEFLELSTAQVRKQFETLTDQTQQLTSLAQKATTDATQPFQAEVAKTFSKST